MNNIFKITAVAASMTVAMGAVQAASVTDATSRHNLSTTSDQGVYAQTGSGINGVNVNGTFAGDGADTTTQVCVFCHTPHGASTSASAPLWNKPIQANAGSGEGIDNSTAGASFKRYASTTLDASNAAVGSVSIACLSCHDGTQAMNAVINVPGSGTSDQSGELTSAMVDDSTGTIGIPNLGTDLSNDHPISMQYAGGGCNATDGACANGDLKDKDFVAPAYQSVNGTPMWWVDVGTTGSNYNGNVDPTHSGGAGTVTGVAGTREKTDMILYTRTADFVKDSDGNGFAETIISNAVTEPFVECASCHDPHQTVSQPVQFLRIDNTGSNVCLACHTK